MQRGKQQKNARSLGRAMLQTLAEPNNNNNNDNSNNHQQQHNQGYCVVSPRVKTKQSKLLNSKSLSQLMSRGLFFKRAKDRDSQNSKTGSQSSDQQLITTKSLPNVVEPAYANTQNALNNTPVLPQMVNDIRSVSLIGLPRHSSCNYFSSNSTSLEEPSLSPIVAAARDLPSFSFSTDSSSCRAASATILEQTNKQMPSQRQQVETRRVDSSNEASEADNKKKANSKYKRLKNTALVLRDVKNSIGLRIKARQASQAFSKLSNELATPPTKLYSPFNIYTPDECKKQANSVSKSRRKLNLTNNSSSSSSSSSTKRGNKNQPIASDCSLMEVDDDVGEDYDIVQTFVEPAKGRSALQHKKHLMRETNNKNRFTFDSPTGKLRETVKDVEQFQRCIEDISKTIRLRDAASAGRRLNNHH